MKAISIDGIQLCTQKQFDNLMKGVCDCKPKSAYKALDKILSDKGFDEVANELFINWIEEESNFFVSDLVDMTECERKNLDEEFYEGIWSDCVNSEDYTLDCYELEEKCVEPTKPEFGPEWDYVRKMIPAFSPLGFVMDNTKDGTYKVFYKPLVGKNGAPLKKPAHFTRGCMRCDGKLNILGTVVKQDRMPDLYLCICETEGHCDTYAADQGYGPIVYDE